MLPRLQVDNISATHMYVWRICGGGRSILLLFGERSTTFSCFRRFWLVCAYGNDRNVRWSSISSSHRVTSQPTSQPASQQPFQPHNKPASQPAYQFRCESILRINDASKPTETEAETLIHWTEVGQLEFTWQSHHSHHSSIHPSLLLLLLLLLLHSTQRGGHHAAQEQWQDDNGNPKYIASVFDWERFALFPLCEIAERKSCRPGRCRRLGRYL